MRRKHRKGRGGESGRIGEHHASDKYPPSSFLATILPLLLTLLATAASAAAAATAATTLTISKTPRMTGPQLDLPPALRLLYDIPTEHEQQQEPQQQAASAPASSSSPSFTQEQKAILREGRRLVCDIEEGVVMFMDQQLAGEI